MIYPADFEVVIGFDRIRQSLAAYCRYETSAEAAAQLAFLTDAAAITCMFDEVDEWRRFAEKHPTASQHTASKDILPMLAGLSVENFYFQEDDLLAILQVIQGYQTLSRLLLKHREDYPLLGAMPGEADELGAAERAILAVINEKGELRPNASARLGEISHDIDRLEREARQVTRNIFKHWRDEGFTADTDLTVREERLVIPVKAEYKRKVRGFVKDVSATGQVLYIEPVESLELNNRLRELYLERRRERERILLLTADKLRPLQSDLKTAMDLLWQTDFIAARVNLAVRMEAHRPRIVPDAVLELRQAENPLLRQMLRQKKQTVVPLNLKLDRTDRIMIVSGPNAGGKSVSLKTALLLQYMAQCGLAIPAAPESTCGIFQHMLLDCGDGQNMDSGLSTFSAHLAHLKVMADMAAPGVLFAIDEIGDGTDPRFGGPIAQTVLETLLNKGATGIVTTHFSRLKEWAGHTDGVINASMAYDTEHLQPLYRLVTGRPGSSFALELLRKTGFGAGMLSRVEELSGEESGRTEDLLLELEARQHELHELLQLNQRKQEHLDLLLDEYHKLKEKLEGRRRDVMEQARLKAARLLDDANRQIEMTIRVIRENRADKEKTRETRAKLQTLRETLKKPAEEQPLVPAPVKPAEKVVWIPGMLARNPGNDSVGEVLEVKKDKLKVAFGLVKMWMPARELEPAVEKTGKGQKKSTSGFNWVERNAAFSPTLDVRGMLAEEAMNKVRNWMDEAYALGQFNLKIVHGRGDGVLRKVLREYFKSLPYIRSYRSEREEQGGDGCTLVELS